ncbi:hypothetical protein Bbelb_159580 [Branchiostoma belcheri]|nr:hypothetical protein Bbelb_159580 [Branchiostoma belcheri]
MARSHKQKSGKPPKMAHSRKQKSEKSPTRKGMNERERQANVSISTESEDNLWAQLKKPSSSNELDWSRSQLKSLPRNLTSLAAIETLNLSNNELAKLPPGMSGLEQLKVLILSDNAFEGIPEPVKSLNSLQCLIIKRNRMNNSQGDLKMNVPKTLKTLDMESNCSLKVVPEGLEHLENLEELNISYCGIETLPDTVGRLTSIRRIHLAGNKLRALPEEIGNLLYLETLDLEGNRRLSDLPVSLYRLRENLRDKQTGTNKGLILDNCQALALPESEIAQGNVVSVLAELVSRDVIKLAEDKIVIDVVEDTIIEGLMGTTIAAAEESVWDDLMLDVTDVVISDKECSEDIFHSMLENVMPGLAKEISKETIDEEEAMTLITDELLEELTASMFEEEAKSAVQVNSTAWEVMGELLEEAIEERTKSIALRESENWRVAMTMMEDLLEEMSKATANSVALEVDEELRLGQTVPDEYDTQSSHDVSSAADDMQYLDLPAGCRLSVPPGATDEDISVISAVLNPHGYDRKIRLQDDELLVSDIIEMRPAGMEFSKPVKLKIPHSLPKFFCEKEFIVKTTENLGWHWKILDTVSHQEQGQWYVTVEVDHFSEFVVVAKPREHFQRVEKGETSTLKSSQQTDVEVSFPRDCVPCNRDILFKGGRPREYVTRKVYVRSLHDTPGRQRLRASYVAQVVSELYVFTTYDLCAIATLPRAGRTYTCGVRTDSVRRWYSPRTDAVRLPTFLHVDSTQKHVRRVVTVALTFYGVSACSQIRRIPYGGGTHHARMPYVLPVDVDTLTCAAMGEDGISGVDSMSHIVKFCNHLSLNSPATIVLPLSPGNHNTQVRVLSCDYDKGPWKDVTSSVDDIDQEGSRVAFRTKQLKAGFAVLRCDNLEDPTRAVNMVIRNIRARLVRIVIFKKWKEPREEGVMTTRIECVLSQRVEDRIVYAEQVEGFERQPGTPTPPIVMMEGEEICVIFKGSIRPVESNHGVDYIFYCERPRVLEFDVKLVDTGKGATTKVELYPGRLERLYPGAKRRKERGPTIPKKPPPPPPKTETPKPPPPKKEAPPPPPTPKTEASPPPKKAIICDYWLACERFKNTLGIGDTSLSPDHDKCYCETCRRGRGDEESYFRGNPQKLYARPFGWSRFGLSVNPAFADKKLKVFTDWHRAYHGTRASSVKQILQTSSQLLMPGDVTMGGDKLGPGKGKGFDSVQVFVSPSIKYAGQDLYAEPIRFQDKRDGKTYTARVAFQLCVRPGSYQVMQETLGFSDKNVTVDPLFNNKELEWFTKERGVHALYGLLVKLDTN